MDFVYETYDYAYTKGQLPSGNSSGDPGSYSIWLSQFFMSMKEENFYTMAEMGMLSHPVRDYYFVLVGSYLAVGMPFWMPLYLYMTYKVIMKAVT